MGSSYCLFSILLDRNSKSPPTRPSAATHPISGHQSPPSPPLDGVGRRGIQGHRPIGATWPDVAHARASTWSPRTGQGSWAQRAAHGGLRRRGRGRAHAEAGLAPQHLHNKV
ncbi:hypothetical protein VPH35_086439 [Triticum aestivum]